MNDHDQDARIDEARWQAQEKARKGDADAEPVELRIAQALRQAPPMALPEDFAARMERMTRRQPERAQAASDAQLERLLLHGLVAALAVSAVGVSAWLGHDWAAALQVLLPGSHALAWVTAVGVCLLANWGLDAWSRSLAQHPPLSV